MLRLSSLNSRWRGRTHSTFSKLLNQRKIEAAQKNSNSSNNPTNTIANNTKDGTETIINKQKNNTNSFFTKNMNKGPSNLTRKPRVENGRWIPSQSAAPESSAIGDQIKNSFLKASEQQRQSTLSQWSRPMDKKSTSTQFNRRTDRREPPPRPQKKGGRNNNNNNSNNTATEAEHIKATRPNVAFKERPGFAAAAQDAVDMGNESGDDSADEMPVETEGKFLQKQIHLEHKRKKLAQVVPQYAPTRNIKGSGVGGVDPDEDGDSDSENSISDCSDEDLNDIKPRQPLAPPTMPSDTGPLSVSELKKMMAQRIEFTSQNMPTNNYVDYREERRARRHAKMNMLKAKKAARKERLFGKKQKRPVTIIREIKIPHNGLTVREIAQRLSMKMTEVVKRLNDLGELLDVPQEGIEDLLIDPDIVELLALELKLPVIRQEAIYRDGVERVKAARMKMDESLLVPRAPIVTVMGHVDHGKTTLLDRLSGAHVAKGEAGGITQRLSAFNVHMGDRSVVMMDTPGHAAFHAMRKNGTLATDIVVLVIAMEDGVRTQTVEAIKLAKKYNCAIVVVLNKADKFQIRSERETVRNKILSSLLEHDVIAEEYGGDVQVVEMSAKSGDGVDNLVDKLLLQAEVMELKASGEGSTEAVVLDAKVEKGRGVVVDLLVKWGTLKPGDAVVVSTAFGKVKTILDDKGKVIKMAGPSTPVRVLGLKSLPVAGQELISVDDLAKAKKIAERRQTLEDTRRINELSRRANEVEGASDAVIVRAILKADSVGALNALKEIIENLSQRTDDVVIHIIRESVGDVTPSDVQLATVSSDGENACILGFNVGEGPSSVRSLAKQNDVRVVTNSVVYRLEEAMEEIMHQYMPEERHLVSEGTATVLQLFDYKAKNTTLKVAGLQVSRGQLKVSNKHVFRIRRPLSTIGEDGRPMEEIVLDEAAKATLKHFKEKVYEVKQGFECGLTLDGFSDYKEGDIIECFRVEKKYKSLVVHEQDRSVINVKEIEE
mmetsp:Transcript_1744/g.2728  ORF Transcript_1744/g.2728 Transcript_1744/m.2728 type:complete len:1001 (-) Transcript_1744:35-3037(-)